MINNGRQQLSTLVADLKQQMLELENQSAALKKRIFDFERQMGGFRRPTESSGDFNISDSA
jgi:hypothetical protein